MQDQGPDTVRLVIEEKVSGRPRFFRYVWSSTRCTVMCKGMSWASPSACTLHAISLRLVS